MLTQLTISRPAEDADLTKEGVPAPILISRVQDGVSCLSVTTFMNPTDTVVEGECESAKDLVIQASAMAALPVDPNSESDGRNS